MKIYSAMILAKKESLKSNHHAHRIGAVITKGGVVLARGYNQLRPCTTGARYAKWKESIHAERDACRKVEKEKLVGATIFVYRETRISPLLAKPCEDCYNMLKELGLKKMVYTTSEFPYYQIEKIER